MWLDAREAEGHWRPNVIKFSQNILKEIRPRAMTRDIDWGIPVPGWEDQPTKRLYVWFDAVIGYLSASIEWARRSGDPDAWRAWWNDPEALSYYFMGKDNIVFHSQIWPAELLAYNGQITGCAQGDWTGPRFFDLTTPVRQLVLHARLEQYRHPGYQRDKLSDLRHIPFWSGLSMTMGRATWHSAISRTMGEKTTPCSFLSLHVQASWHLASTRLKARAT